MIDFTKDVGDSFDRAIEHRILSSLLPSLIIFDISMIVIGLVAIYFAAHIGLWLYRGHPVVKDTYRASHSSYWLVDKDAVRIRTK